jgi:uncharacterized integral membrane protein (TIGR00698 family)
MTGSLVKKVLFVLLLLACAIPRVSTADALAAGILFALTLENPWPQEMAIFSKKLLKISVVGLGFGLSIGEVIQEGRHSIVYSAVGIAFTLTLGYLLGRACKTPSKTSSLIAFGTAICGGSAIAAMAPVIKAENEDMAVSLATIFTLNSVALLLFPVIGHFLHLSQHSFGVWAGLAIHDISSVVGATSVYGRTALDIGTTVKMTRVLWIVPVVAIFGWRNKTNNKIGIPLFIVGFMIAACLRSFFPQYTAHVWNLLARISEQALVVTLFLIGAGLSRSVLRKVGVRPFVQGVSLWLIVSVLTLTAIMHHLIS